MLRKTFTFESAETTIRVFQAEGMIFINDVEAGEALAIEPDDVHHLITALKALETEANLELENQREED